MKRFISIVLISVCILGLVGCGENKDVDTKPTENQVVEQEDINGNSIIGEWSDVEKGTVMKVTEDGKLMRNDVEVATYEITPENTVKINNTSGDMVEITYEIDGDILKWGTNFEEAQIFKKVKPIE